MYTAREKSIFALIAIIVVSTLLAALIVPNIREQKPSDCNSSQIYDSSTKRCREKTSDEIKKERVAALQREADLGKQNGTVCLSAAETWKNIGKTTCVAFYPGYFYRTGYGTLFINEKQDYKNGFVVYFTQRNMLSWETFLAKYRKPLITVYGKIELYEGHPEIKVSSLSQIREPVLINCETSYGCIYRQGAQL